MKKKNVKCQFPKKNNSFRKVFSGNTSTIASKKKDKTKKLSERCDAFKKKKMHKT